jgi:hypothetical protein
MPTDAMTLYHFPGCPFSRPDSHGRARSSFTLDPHWSRRPMPPRDKWAPAPDDGTLGLVTR